MNPVLLPQPEAAKALSISTRSLARLIADGRIETRAFGRRVLIPTSEVERIGREGIEGPIRTKAAKED